MHSRLGELQQRFLQAFFSKENRFSFRGVQRWPVFTSGIERRMTSIHSQDDGFIVDIRELIGSGEEGRVYRRLDENGGRFFLSLKGSDLLLALFIFYRIYFSELFADLIIHS